jgi:hypothetical protein
MQSPAVAASQPLLPVQQVQPMFPANLPLPAQPPRIPSPPRRHRGMFWVAVLAALAALAGGAVVAVTAYLGASSPDAVAKAYFRALGRGDAPGALAMGAVPPGSRTFLTSDALRAADKIGKLTDVTVLSVAQAGGKAQVTVQYQLGFRPNPVVVNDTVHLTKHGHTWRLDETAVETRLDPEVAGRRLTLAGAAVPSGMVLLFPGALPMTVDTPNLDISDRVVHLDGFVPSNVEPEVSSVGRQAVVAAVGSAVQACLDAKRVAPCPSANDDRAVPASTRGTLPRDVGANLDITVADGPDGRIDVNGTVEVRGRYQRLDFDNLPVTRSGNIALVVKAHCYATDPSKLAWDTPS